MTRERFEAVRRGDLAEATTEPAFGDGVSTRRGVVADASGPVVLEDGTRLDTRAETMTTASGGSYDLYELRVVVPAPQVRKPGVEAGDVVKFKTGSQTYRVERVEDGIVYTHDGWSRPVTHVTAFDEDTGGHDPFSFGGASDWF